MTCKLTQKLAGHCTFEIGKIARRLDKGAIVGKTCDVKFFKLKPIEAKVWKWLKGLLGDSERLQQKLEDYQSEQEAVTRPTRERLAVVEELLEQNRDKLDRWLEMYADQLIRKEELIEKKQGVDKVIVDLEQQHKVLVDRLHQNALTTLELKNIVELSGKLKDDLNLIEETQDFDEMRWYIDRLRLKATVVWIDGSAAKIEVSCILGSDTLICNDEQPYKWGNLSTQTARSVMVSDVPIVRF